MIIKTERLILRPWEESDAEDLYFYAKDERVGPAAGWLPHTSVENSREIIKTILSVPETYAVCLKEDNRAIGSIGLMLGQLSNIHLPENQAELGYWLGVPFWGQGLIPEAARALIRRGFYELNLEKIWCGYFDGNEKSKRVQQKCGFSYHHTVKDIVWKTTDKTLTEHITCLGRKFARPLFIDEIPAAKELAWDVFMRFEAPVYSEEGIQTFRNFLDGRQGSELLNWYGAFDGGELIGTLAMRENQHISLFFVKAEQQGKGFGRLLFERMKNDYETKKITVNSSPYAVPIYKKLGFVPTSPEQTADGIRFTPMKFE